MKTLIIIIMTFFLFNEMNSFNIKNNLNNKIEFELQDTSFTTIKSFNKDYKLIVRTMFSYSKDSLNEISIDNIKTFNQELNFLYQERIIKTVDVYEPLKYENKKRLSNYCLMRIGTVYIETKKIYILYFYIANGEPEIYLYYDENGLLLFQHKCFRQKENIIVYNYDKKKVKQFLKRDDEIDYIDVKGSVEYFKYRK